jgi:hypothetical protein
MSGGDIAHIVATTEKKGAAAVAQYLYTSISGE